jgi:hypothetical protein
MFDHASKSFIRLNPNLFNPRAVESPERPQPKAALEQDLPAKPICKIRLEVCIVGFRRKLLDDDNFTAGNKPLRDAIAEEIGIDDGDPRIHFTYHQIKTDGREDTAVKIEAYMPGMRRERRSDPCLPRAQIQNLSTDENAPQTSR